MRFRLNILLAMMVLVGPSFIAYGRSPAERELTNVVRLQRNALHGRDLFDTCTACHGTSGEGVIDGTVPAIAAQPFKVVAWALIAFRHGSRQDTRMKHFADHHVAGEQDIADLAIYISRLQPTPSVQHGTGQQIARGAEVYAGRCASCHGAKANGNDERRYPRLAGQHYEYLAHQLRDAPNDRWATHADSRLRALHALDPS
ncbi:MAG TPA: c-type cytochrome, partial [Steroidobacteraceae bacterium]